MIRNDIKKLFVKLISSNAISNEFLDKFNSAYFQEGSIEPFKSPEENKIIIGIYFLFFYNQFLVKQKNKQSTIEKEIKETVESFNNNSISMDAAKERLENLVYQNMNYKINLEILDATNKLLPFSQFKSTIEIERMFQDLNALDFKNVNDLKKLFIDYFDRFERNKEYLKDLARTEFNSSVEFNQFITKLIEFTNQKTILDSSSLNERFATDITHLIESFFEKFKEKTIQPLNFAIEIGKTLGEKNNQFYFFIGNELDNLEPLPDQPYVSNLEMNSKINTTSNKSGLSPQINLWDMVGSLVVDPIKNGIGIAEYPYEDKETNQIYLAVVIEQEIDLSESENFYHQIQSMRITEVSDKTYSRRQMVISEISDSLDVPINLALFPSIIEEYLVRNKGVSIDFEILKKKLREEYYLINSIAFDQLNGIITIPDDLEPVSHKESFKLYPSPKLNYLENKLVYLANDHAIGKSSTEFQLLDSWYISVELDLPSKLFLDKLLIKIRKTEDTEQNDLWKLRFTIAKVFDIFEAEALLIGNIWKYIWHEKISILPFDVLTGFVAFTPAGAVNKEKITDESIQLARSIEVLHFDSLLKNEPFILMSEQKIAIGKAIAFYLDQNNKQIYLIYCNISEVEILKRMNRDYSQNSLEKIAKRVSKALGLNSEKIEIGLHPRYLLTYILFYSIQFNAQIDFSNLSEVTNWLMTEFELKKVPIQKIKAIDEKNLLIEIEH